MSAFTDALNVLLDRELHALTDEEYRAIREERAELLRKNHRGELSDEPLPPAPDLSGAFDPKEKQLPPGDRDA